MEKIFDDGTGNVNSSKKLAKLNPIDHTDIVGIWLYGCSKKNKGKFRVEVKSRSGTHLVFSGFTHGTGGVGTYGLGWLLDLYQIPIGIGILTALVKEFDYTIVQVYKNRWTLEFVRN